MGNSGSTQLQHCLNAVFSHNLAGVSYPSNPLYQLVYVKPYNLDDRVTPAAVTRPSNSQQVADIVKCAVASNVKVQPRSGGHSYANFGLGGQDGTVVVDLVNFQHFSMDQSTWQATIGSGTLLGDVTTRLHDNGNRAIAHGTCPAVGIGGHATIGGLGPLSRQWGSALDHVLEVEVVLANSTITRASEILNPDLFFALKGAAAGLGIITEFKVRTQPEPGDSVHYTYSFTLGSHDDMAPLFEAWQKLIADSSLTRKFASQVTVTELGMIIQGTYFGSKSEYNSLGLEDKLPRKPNFATVELKNWLGSISHWANEVLEEVGGGIPAPFYSKSLALRNDTLMSGQTIKDVFKLFGSKDKGTIAWAAIFDLEAGAINDVAPNATAYGHRDALFYIQTYALGIPHVSQKTKDFLANINKIIEDSMPGANLGAYAGYVDPALTNAQERYWGSNLPRLQRIKKEYDPNDVFHNPQSVRPA
ncbi:hypothetical protein H2198_010682 [Neophaeococcomyces mojaviensis]|uniref:Uncharacterized protein n=1 Tax=Neophaeococcomyces mojaviensis TaxID=3383035 RepID=A0ACC2ZR09_9EURO|nr:hypothetical protein H2198_010682 [Knufia sp. JES_112]